MIIEERLLKHRTISASGCWEWSGYLGPKGYGHIFFERKNQRVHRVAWRIFVGKIPEGRMVLHECNNPKCFNPLHLKLGTNSDNMKDSWRAGSRGVSFYQLVGATKECKQCNASFPFTRQRTTKRWKWIQFCSRACWCRYMNSGRI